MDYSDKRPDSVLKIDHADGTTTIDFNPSSRHLSIRPLGTENYGKAGKSHNSNLAMDMDEGELATIATDLLEGVYRDDLTRKKWLDTSANGIELLGLELERPRSDTGNASAPLAGMSTCR